MGSAKRDSYGVPGLLGHGEDGVVPIRSTEDGKLLVKIEGGDSSGGSTTVLVPQYDFKLAKTEQLDLSTVRNKEMISVEFDCLAIGYIQGTLVLTVNGQDMTIDKCLSMDLTESSVQVSNKQQEGLCELWFFKKEKVVS